MFSQRSIRHNLFALNSKLDIYTDTAVKNGFFSEEISMVRLHFSRVIFQALDLYVYATRSDK